MKIARQPRILASSRVNGESPPGSLSEGAAERSEAEGVSFGEWYKPKFSELRRGDENRPKPRILASTRLNGESHPGSLSEGAAERSEAEGVSFDGCSGPMVYPPPIINSEIFEWLRSSRYTPSVSPSGCQLPQRGSRDGVRTIQRTSRKPQRCGRFSSPLRNSEYLTAQKFPVSTGEAIPGGAGHPRMGTSPKRHRKNTLRMGDNVVQ